MNLVKAFKKKMPTNDEPEKNQRNNCITIH